MLAATGLPQLNNTGTLILSIRRDFTLQLRDPQQQRRTINFTNGSITVGGSDRHEHRHARAGRDVVLPVLRRDPESRRHRDFARQQ
jgi:hypothetical protein